MPISNYEEYQPRPDERLPIFRYMSLDKFLSLLTNQTLYFCRVDQFQDPYEGIYPELSYRDNKAEFKKLGYDIDELKEMERVNRNKACASCWTIAESESSVFWMAYSDQTTGVAIKSDVKTLVSALDSCSLNLILSEMQYIDYENDRLPNPAIITPMFHKRPLFNGERELRIVHFDSGRAEGTIGINVDVDLSQLVHEVIIAPEAPGWLHDSLACLVDRFLPGLKITKSNLLKQPPTR